MPSTDAGDLALLRYDPDLRAAIEPADMPLAERAIVARRILVDPGTWEPPATIPAPGLAILVDGILVREVVLAGRTSAQLLGPGAVLHDLAEDDTSLPCQLSWSSAGRSTIALLDYRFERAARHWPELWAIIHRRALEQIKTAARWNAATGLPRVEQRILGVFWLIADRWGVMTPSGIAIRMPLTHESIGHMAAARRPTVSIALAGLAEQGLLTCTGGREWLLSPDSLELTATVHQSDHALA